MYVTTTASNSSENANSNISEWGLKESWWGRWDLNPGSPAPQAGILDQTSRENTVIHGFALKLDDDPAYSEYNSRILKTLEMMLANNKKPNTRYQAYQTLRKLNRETDLMNPDAVIAHINTLKKKDGKTPLEDSSKERKANSYQYFAIANGLKWKKPTYKYDSKIPITPTPEQADAIIASAPTLNSATYFRILLESGFEGQELHNTARKDIDTEQGIITIAGTKQHNGRSYKLKASTADLQRLYISKHQREHLFPRPQVMGDTWRDARHRAAKKLGRPDLNNIPLKGLRNLSGILAWRKFPDPWKVMLHMGHKKLDTTQDWPQSHDPHEP
jgi:integrase